VNLPTLMFRMHANDDPEITCVICYPSNRKPCEYFFALRGSGRVSGIGVHKACVEQAMQRNQVHDEQLERERDEARLMRDRIAAERDEAEKALAVCREIGCVRSDHKHLEGLNAEPAADEMDAYFERVRADIASWPKWKREAFQFVTHKELDDTDPGEHAILPVDSDETER
jgi:hypothetical protein